MAQMNTPKRTSALDAVQGGVQHVTIINQEQAAKRYGQLAKNVRGLSCFDQTQRTRVGRAHSAVAICMIAFWRARGGRVDARRFKFDCILIQQSPTNRRQHQRMKNTIEPPTHRFNSSRRRRCWSTFMAPNYALLGFGILLVNQGGAGASAKNPENG